MSKESSYSLPAQSFYSSRAPTYDSEPSSFHPALSRTLVLLASPPLASHVLCACSGTGYEVFPAAEITGPEGLVIGVDVAEGMIEVAERKAADLGYGEERVKFVRGDAQDPELLRELVEERRRQMGGEKDGRFDVVTCGSAFALLRDLKGALETWREVMKPTGVLVLDIFMPCSDPAGLVLEDVANRMGVRIHSQRLWAKDPPTIKAFFQAAGFSQVEVTESEDYGPPSQSAKFLAPDGADEAWEYLMRNPLVGGMATLDESRLGEAKALWNEGWKAMMGEKEFVEKRIKAWIVVARK